ncbi:hypothetical protein ACWEOW_18745 [Monashia sp. NPDC004114]
MVAVFDVVGFRGIWTDATTVDMLEELARITGPDILVRPIRKAGSFQGVTVRKPDGSTEELFRDPDSGFTHTRAGVVDLDAEHLNDVQARTLETLARSLGSAAWFREAIPDKWQRHIHVVRIDADPLADSAQGQVTAYKDNRNGLSGESAGPDTGNRDHVSMTWAAYEKDNVMTPEQQKAILNAIAQISEDTWTVAVTNSVTGGASKASSWLERGTREAISANTSLATLLNEVRALQAEVTELSNKLKVANP